MTVSLEQNKMFPKTLQRHFNLRKIIYGDKGKDSGQEGHQNQYFGYLGNSE